MQTISRYCCWQGRTKTNIWMHDTRRHGEVKCLTGFSKRLESSDLYARGVIGSYLTHGDMQTLWMRR